MALTSIDNFLEVADYSTTSIRTMQNSAGQVGFAPHNLILASEDFSDSNWTKTDTTVTSNAAAAPDGTTTADKISHDDTTASLYQGGVSVVSGQTYAMGIGVKYIDHQWVRLSADGQVSWVDIQNGVVGTDNSSGLTLTALTDNWFWVTIPVSVSDASFDFAVALSAGNNNNTETSGTSAYIWGAHLYENGLAGMFDVPEDQRALASLTKYLPNKAVVTGPNLVSNGTFDSNTNGWTAVDGTIAVSGGALLVSNDGTGSNIGYAYQAITTEVGKSYRVGFENVDTDLPAIRVGTSVYGTDLLVYSNVPQGVHTGHFTATSTTTYVTLSNNAFAGAANRKWDNITVTKVDRDPTAARFLPRRDNHEDIDGAWVKGLKVESEARTNLVTEALDFSTDWLNNNTASLAQDATGVDGETSAVTLLDSGATGTGAVQVYDTITVATTTVYTFSVYAKADQLDWVTLRGEGFTTPANGGVYFDLTNGVLGTESTGFTGSIEDVGSGWFRCAITFTTGVSDTSGNVVIKLADADGDAVVDLDGTSSILIWGAQLEAGSTPSSLIPTYGATRTRTAETFTQKEDKIVWPNTTYVDGTELVTNGGFDTDTDWTKGTNATISGGTLSYAGGSGNTDTSQSGVSITNGNPYEITFTVSNYTSGSVLVRLGGTTYASKSANGTYTTVVVGSTFDTAIVDVSADFVGDIDNISVKEINPRALAVVMHGYMTYADEGEALQTVFWRQEADTDNRIRATLDTSSSNTGRPFAYSESNNTADSSAGATDAYSPGINVPFKIASRHLDDSLQAAADGTATTENTTPPGLPDLSATQAEWFYDFMGHITFLGVGQESSADKLDSTNGPTTLTTATGGSFLA